MNDGGQSPININCAFIENLKIYLMLKISANLQTSPQRFPIRQVYSFLENIIKSFTLQTLTSRTSHAGCHDETGSKFTLNNTSESTLLSHHTIADVKEWVKLSLKLHCNYRKIQNRERESREEINTTQISQNKNIRKAQSNSLYAVRLTIKI